MKIIVLCVAMFFCCIGVYAQEAKTFTNVTDDKDIVTQTDDLVSINNVNSEFEEASEEKEIVPSRSVNMKKKQNLNVDYPGNGWIYLGETEGTLVLRYSGRKLSETKTSFTLTAQNEGEAMLHFYKNDALTGSYIEDYLFVKVNGESEVASSVTAPSYADIVPPHPIFDAEPRDLLAKDIQTESAFQNNTLLTDVDTNINVKEAPKNQVSSKKENTPAKKEENTNKEIVSKETVSNKTESKVTPSSKVISNERVSNETANTKAETIIQDAQVSSSIKNESSLNKTDSSAKKVERNSNERSSNELSSNKKEIEAITKTNERSSIERSSNERSSNNLSSNNIEETLPTASKSQAENVSQDKLLTLAKEAYDAKDYEKTLSYLDEFFEQSLEKIDEGLFLQAQALEAPSKNRNIKLSLSVYKKLVEEYPQSANWDKAHERIIYIERFYFNIR